MLIELTKTNIKMLETIKINLEIGIPEGIKTAILENNIEYCTNLFQDIAYIQLQDNAGKLYYCRLGGLQSAMAEIYKAVKPKQLVKEMVIHPSIFNRMMGYTSFEDVIQDMKSDFDKDFLEKASIDLAGIKIEYSSEGNHEHDGDNVDYTFTFTDSEGNIGEYYTSMNLVFGLNERQPVTLKFYKQ